MSNLTGRTEEDVVKKVTDNPTMFQQAANVPGMPQFNRTRDLANQTAAELDQEELDRAAADQANADADAARATAQVNKDTAQDTALSQNAAADATRTQAQATKDANQDTAATANATAITNETTRAKAAEDANTAADTTRAATQATRDNGQDTAIAGKASTSHASTHISTGTDPIAAATTTASGLMSAADKTKANATPVAIATGSASVPALSLLGSQDVPVTLNKTMPSTNYRVRFDIFGAGLGSFKVVVKSQTVDTVVLTLTAIAAISAGGTIEVTAIANTY